jgi:aminopeptidase N
VAARRLLTLFLVLAVAAGCSSPPPVGVLRSSSGAPGLGDPYYPNYGNGGYDVRSYRLEVRYDPGPGRLDGHEVITATATQYLSRFDLDFGALSVGSVTVNGAAARTERPGGVELAVLPAQPLPAGKPFTVELSYGATLGGGSDADDSFLHNTAGAVVVGEPENATSWFAANDHPLDKATYEFAITVPDGWTGIANGVPGGSTQAGGWTTWRWSEGLPMASYLATMAVGKYRVITGDYQGKPVYSAVAASIPADQTDAAIARTPEIVDFLASQFGPYPFDSVGGIVPDEPRLKFALEIQTRPVYAAGFFARGSVDDKTWVLAHELAHQWFGDSVSVHFWRDIWLNEGFATYAEWLWSEHQGRATAQQIFDRTYAQPAEAKVWSPPPGDPGVKALFGASVYQRGAMAVHALRVAVGDPAFFTILRAWTSERRYGNGDTAEFIALAERISGRTLQPLFQVWLFEKGKPPPPKPAG